MKSQAQARRRLAAGLACLAAAAVGVAGCALEVDEQEELGSTRQELGRSLSPPAGLSASQVPQFVAITFDDNFGSEGMGWATNFFGSKTNPAGSGNAATFDGTPVKTTYFHNSTYLGGMQSSWQTA